jgi:hypothetical protein
MTNNWKKILNELSYRVSTGIPDLRNEQHLMKLWDILKEHNWPVDARVELLKRLDEQGKERPCPICEAAQCQQGQTTANTGCISKSGGGKQTSGQEEPTDKKPKGEEEPTDKKPKGEEEPQVEKNQNQERWDEVRESEQSNVEFEIEKNSVIGDIDSGDNKVKQDMLTHGFKGYNEATGKKPAKGSAGSAFGEIVSGQGVKMLFNENKTAEELAEDMYQQFGETKLAEEQSETSLPKSAYPDHINDAVSKAIGNGTKKKPEFPDDYKKAMKEKAKYSKCIIAARSAKVKHKNAVDAAEKAKEAGNYGTTERVEDFYGADDSMKAMTDELDKAKANGKKVQVVIPPSETPILVDPDDLKDFIQDGPNDGYNASDTAIFTFDEEGNVICHFDSDKIDVNNIQDNSTIIKEGKAFEEHIEKSDLPEETKKECVKVITDINNQITEIEDNYKKQAIPIADVLVNEVGIDKLTEVADTFDDTLNRPKTGNIDSAMFSKKGELREEYKEYLPKDADPDNLTTAQKIEAITKKVAAGKGSTSDVKVVQKLGLAIQDKYPDQKGVDVKKNISEMRKKVVNLQRERVELLNKKGSVEVDGTPIPVGDYVESQEAVRGLSLYLMDEIQYEEGNAKSLKGIVKKNMGGVEVTGKELRKCIGVKNSKDFQKRFEAREREKLQTDKKGNITGKEVFAYFVNPETGEEIEIGSKHYRSKGGSTDKTSNTLKFSPDLQKCFKSGKKQ